MGQSPSTTAISDKFNRHQFPDFEFDFDFGSHHATNPIDHDFTADLPDDCLAGIFTHLNTADRNRCSLVCRRWLRVDGQTRRRLSLSAKAEILDLVPAVFTRFESVTKLALRCDRRSTSVNDEGLMLISLRCVNLTRLKLRGCREITELGMAAVGDNCKALKKLSCASCVFGIKGINAVVSRCRGLEELSVKRLRGANDGAEVFSSQTTSLTSVCLKEIANGQSFAPLLIGSKKLRTLKVIGCLGQWDDTLEKIGNLHASLVDVHLEKVQVSDVGLVGLSKCLGLDTLHIVKTAECSNVGLNLIAENCRMLRKLHVDGWRTNKIGDVGLISVANHCHNLQELALIGIYPTSSSLEAIASKCKSLERLALCGLNTVGDAEVECVANKCVALKKLCIKGCPISNVGIEALASGCPNLIKFKVRRCRKVTGMVVEWVRVHRESLAFSFDNSDYEVLNASQSDHDQALNDMIAFHRENGAAAAAAASNGYNGFATLRATFGFLANRSIVQSALRRWYNNDNVPAQ
ncbi:putative VIER F-box protein 2 [Stylosanthes scabra]|uniref:VIER F-box protein 2 n=1 Tax=Stylosanthes scabra TaxID=79078 RepID=A0ABU6X4K9_9FABA|nr:putative VIER F-box protein 2 [Stylosanthes scabra]